MSFSGLVASLLSRFLGDYIEGKSHPVACLTLKDFKEDDLDISLLKGSATVTNLKLKRNLLDKFHLPVTIREGKCLNVMAKVRRLHRKTSSVSSLD